MTPCSNKSLILAVLGLIFVILGSGIHVFWLRVFKGILSRELPLRSTSRAFNFWKDTNEIPMSMDFYFFNWTNPNEIKTPGKKPSFIEVGPYSFIQRSKKINIVFHPQNSTVSYEMRKFWYFDPSRSAGSLQDKIVHLNVVAVAATHKIRYWSFFLQNSLSMMLNSYSGIHVIKTVGELLFDGYEDSIINMGKFAKFMDNADMPPHDKFGWFYLRNGSSFFEGHINMATGEDDIEKIGAVKSWNYKDTLPYYKSPCNAVEGGTGELWAPRKDKSDIIVFSTDICRSITYEYTGTVTHQGMEGYQYSVGSKTLGNTTFRRYPHEQAKFFEKTTTTEDFFYAEYSTEKGSSALDDDTVNMGKCYCNGECSPMGLMNITACRYGAPGFVSLPHFHKADPVLRDQVIGMKPNDRDHNFYITLEPTTGVPIDVNARFQINILLQPSKTVTLLKDVPKVYFPILWFNLRGGTTETLAASLRQLLWLNTIGFHGSVILALFGGLMLIIAALLQFHEHGRRNSMSIRKTGEVKVQSEKVYMGIVNPADENERTDRQLYPML